MVDFNGGGGLAGTNPFATMPTGPAMSANQINASMGMGPGGIGDQSQALYNNIFGNFGQQTDYYSGLGAAYGRNTGGFGGYGGNNDIYGPVGGNSVFNTGTSAFNTYGVPDNLWNSMSQSDRMTFNGQMAGSGASPVGGIGSDAVGAPNQPAPTPQQGYVGGYNPYDASPPSAQGNIGGGGGRDNLAGLMWQGTNSNSSTGNIYGAPDNLWNQMSQSDRMTFNGQMQRSGAQPSGGGISQAPPYQGDPFSALGPSGQGIQQGGGFGAPGFGIQTPGANPNAYTGQPGFGLDVGRIAAPNSGGSVYNEITGYAGDPWAGTPFANTGR
jgi:hypothetical protein